ncbi:MAG TPA: hypothetical protein VFE16_10015 [Candidatus Cybelea sp.]|jgi:hypothetical protein|nr:hypothetical protein [Candidatus Cybelea sp.]
MRLTSLAVSAAIAAGLLAGCAGGNLNSTASSVPSAGGLESSHLVNGHFVPHWSRLASAVPAELRPFGAQRTLGRLVPDAVKKPGGIYASEFFGGIIDGYPLSNKNNKPPTCTLTATNPNDIAVDRRGDLIDPDGGSRTVIVYKGPRLCGAEVGSPIADPYGQPSDAASANAKTGEIVVGNIFDNSQTGGSISICTISGGCTANLTNANMYEVAGVALAKNGDCWADATNSGGTANLTYFKKCSGAGQTSTGFMNTYYGGLDIDKNGYLVSIDAFTPAVWIYKGCNPACIKIGGPFPLQGETIYGHLNQASTAFVAGDYADGVIDVYKYRRTGLAYQYSFNNGLVSSEDVEGAAYSPASKE